MKKGVYIINTAAGELVDIVALYNNLLSGHIGGVALDAIECDKLAVNDNEINPQDEQPCFTQALAVHKLLGMSNVILTPRIAYNTKDSIKTILNSMFNSIRDFSKGLHTNQIRY